MIIGWAWVEQLPPALREIGQVFAFTMHRKIYAASADHVGPEFRDRHARRVVFEAMEGAGLIRRFTSSTGNDRVERAYPSQGVLEE